MNPFPLDFVSVFPFLEGNGKIQIKITFWTSIKIYTIFIYLELIEKAKYASHFLLKLHTSVTHTGKASDFFWAQEMKSWVFNTIYPQSRSVMRYSLFLIKGNKRFFTSACPPHPPSLHQHPFKTLTTSITFSLCFNEYSLYMVLSHLKLNTIKTHWDAFKHSGIEEVDLPPSNRRQPFHPNIRDKSRNGAEVHHSTKVKTWISACITTYVNQ